MPVSVLSQERSAAAGWTGLEFAAGIPGTLGGAVYMNAGASGADMRSVLRRVEFVSVESGRQVRATSAGGFPRPFLFFCILSPES